jgi:gas vesicle protein
LHDEAAAAAATPDLRERVRELTARTLHERRMALNDIREIVAAITSGVGSGLAARGGEMKEGLKQAVAGLDDAVGSAAQTASYTLSEAAAQGKAFKDNELKASLEQLRDLETQIVDALKQTASQSGGKLKEELGYLGDHLKHSGTRTGEQVREALKQLASGVKTTSAAGRAGLSESASTATERLSQVASGILEALSESLKRQSERLRS